MKRTRHQVPSGSLTAISLVVGLDVSLVVGLNVGELASEGLFHLQIFLSSF